MLESVDPLPHFSAQLIVAPAAEGDDRTRPLRFRRSFAVAGDIVSARLLVTACGVYQAHLNGQAVGDHVLAPGWTSYRHRHRIQSFDVTRLVQAGANAIGIEVAEGWFRGRLGFWQGVTDVYGTEIGPFGQLDIEMADGSRRTYATDTDWRWQRSPTLVASIYDGETYDQRLENRAWATADFEDSAWHPVELRDFDTAALIPQGSPPMRRIEELSPVFISVSPSGMTLVDFGQNLSGRLRVKLPSRAGHTITFRHAEVLAEGELAVRPLRNARATDVVLTDGSGGDWEPLFTFHGFRYVEVTGWPGDITADDLRAVVLHSDMVPTGTFKCSDDLLNQLHENVRWSMKGNFLDIPTDCPQRDERLGWTGDIQVFAPTASFLFDCRLMLSSWLEDLAAEQADLGFPPVWVPFTPGLFRAMPAAGWSDAAVIVPWVLYQRFGDIETLARQYPSMTSWVDTVATRLDERGLWTQDMQFGDWLDPSAPHDNPAKTRTDAILVASAYRVYVIDLLVRAAEVLGQTADVERYRALSEQARAIFTAEYVTPAGRLMSDSPTGYALALQFNLLPSAVQRATAQRRLRELVAADNYHIGTGFLGTPIICDALVAAGEVDGMYHLLTQPKCPSWLYPVTMGATSMWERWDSMLPDGSINTGDMTSFNHYALGAVADFLHRRVAGLAPGAPGYRTIDVRPIPGGGLTSAAATYRTPHGDAKVSWTRVDGVFSLEVDVPDGCDAVVALPDGSHEQSVAAGTHHFSCPVRAAADDPPRPAPRGPFG
jgi:alpha-L-rhamnosidase